MPKRTPDLFSASGPFPFLNVRGHSYREESYVYFSRQIVRDYVEASETLLELDDLTDAEIDAVQEMLDRLAEMLTSQRDSEP